MPEGVLCQWAKTVIPWFSMLPANQLTPSNVPETAVLQTVIFKIDIFRPAGPTPAEGVPEYRLLQIVIFHISAIIFKLLNQAVEKGFPANCHNRFLYPLNGAGYRARKTNKELNSVCSYIRRSSLCKTQRIDRQKDKLTCQTTEPSLKKV